MSMFAYEKCKHTHRERERKTVAHTSVQETRNIGFVKMPIARRWMGGWMDCIAHSNDGKTSNTNSLIYKQFVQTHNEMCIVQTRKMYNTHKAHTRQANFFYVLAQFVWCFGNCVNLAFAHPYSQTTLKHIDIWYNYSKDIFCLFRFDVCWF